MPTLTHSSTGGAPPIDTELPGYGGGDDHQDRPGRGNERRTSMTGIAVLMCASIMTFGSFLSAMVIRRGLGAGWGHTPLPNLLYWNTGVLLLSSVVLDIGRRRLRLGNRRHFNWIWSLGTGLGVIFVAGQFCAWRLLAQRGIFVGSNPSTSFFYVVTWAHAAHAGGAILALLYIEYRALRFQLGPSRRTLVDVTTAFWHFLDVLWLGIIALFRYWA